MPRVGDVAPCTENNINTLYLWQTAFAYALRSLDVYISDAEISFGPVSPKIQTFCLTLNDNK